VAAERTHHLASSVEHPFMQPQILCFTMAFNWPDTPKSDRSRVLHRTCHVIHVSWTHMTVHMRWQCGLFVKLVWPLSYLLNAGESMACQCSPWKWVSEMTPVCSVWTGHHSHCFSKGLCTISCFAVGILCHQSVLIAPHHYMPLGMWNMQCGILVGWLPHSKRHIYLWWLSGRGEWDNPETGWKRNIGKAGENGKLVCHFWATVCKTVCPMLSVCCLSVLSVTFVHWPNGWTD